MDENAREVDSYSDLIDNARGVMVNAAFTEWKRVMEAQMVGRQQLAVAPMKNQDDAFERNYQNGEAAGIQLAIQMWDQLIATWTDELDKRLAESNTKQEN